MTRGAFFSLVIALSGIALGCPEIALAQGNVPTIRTEHPSSALLLPSAFETMGYRAQSMVLEHSWDLILSIAVFLWIASAIYYLSRFIISQESNGILGLLIGPILLMFLLKTTTVGSGVEWRRELPAASPQEIASLNSNVSWFFHQYNRFISYLSQSLIAVLTNDKNRKPLKKFMARQEVLSDLLGLEMTDSGLIALTKNTVAQCNGEINAARLIALGQRDPVFRSTPEYKLAVREYGGETTRGKWTEATHTVPMADVVRGYLRQLLQNEAAINSAVHTAKVCHSYLGPLRTVVKSGQLENRLNKPVSCEELWCWIGIGAENEVRAGAQSARDRYDLDEETWKEVVRDLAEKLTTQQPFLDWDGRPLYGVSTVRSDASLIPVIMGGYLIRKVMQRDFHSGFISEFAREAGVERFEPNFRLDISAEENLKTSNRLMLHQLAENRRYELFTFAMNLPYVQSYLLFFAILSFPFFALTVVIPGQGAHGLVLILRILTWLKSLDIGWVLIALSDDVLWEFLPHSSNVSDVVDPAHSPITMFDAAFTGDLSYSMANYYAVVGGLFLFVPLLTAQLLLGGWTIIGKTLLSGALELGTRYGTMVASGVSNRQLLPIAYLREGNFARFMMANLHKDATPEITDMRKFAQEMREVAKDIGRDRTFSVPTDWLFPGGRADSKIEGKRASIIIDRWANELEMELDVMNAKMWLFRASGTREFYTLEQRRAPITQRIEHWNVTSPYHAVYADLDQMKTLYGARLAQFRERVNLRKIYMEKGIKS